MEIFKEISVCPFVRQKFCLKVQTFNGRLPLEDGSDRHETLPKRVSDDPRRVLKV